MPAPDEEFDFPEVAPDDEIPDWVNTPSPPPPNPDKLEFSGIEDEVPSDPEPAFLRSAPTGNRRAKTSTKGPRITAAVRQDIGAKVRLMVTVPGAVWQARDPICGGAWMYQSDPIAAALTDIILDSPDLVAWFTGPAGGFMKYLNLIMAVQPVVMTVWTHHIVHSISTEDMAQPAPDDAARAAAGRYAA